MGTNFFRSLIAGLNLLLGISAVTFASDYVQQVIIVNEGYNDFSTGEQLVPVTVASYHPSTKVYSVFDTIEGQRFASDVIVAGDYIYVAADKLLVKYDKNTLQRVAAQNVVGIRNIAAWNDKLIVTRGEYLQKFSSYFQIYNQSDLSFFYELDTFTGPKYSTQNIEVMGDKVYFLINNGFDFPNYKGLIGVADLSAQSYEEYDLGADGLNPDNLMRDGNMLYTLNNKDFTGSSVSVFNVNTGSIVTTNLPNVSTGCGTSTFFTSNVWYQQYGSMKLHQFNPVNSTVVDSFDFGKSFYGLSVDTVNNLLYATTTDYVSTGMAYIYNAAHALIDSFSVGVSAGNIAFDVRKTTGISNNASNSVMFRVYPNPANETLNIENLGALKAIELLDASGRKIISATSPHTPFDIRHLEEGLYFIAALDKNGFRKTVSFVKQ
ncbi:MAG TPA: T9SS type A sorting domain-containing protein [Chitinophagales bacterium]|nr:T9SS type A sorting domain-containing protein [Chitinophagales bacterium]